MKLPEGMNEDDLDDVVAVGTIQNYDDEAYREVVIENLIEKYRPYIGAIAYKYQWILDKDDLVQEGTLGLLDAVRGFKNDKKVKFKTYATPWIKKRMLRAIENTSSLIRVPVYIQQINRHIKKIQVEHPDITKEELALKLNVTPNQIGYALDVNRQVLFDQELISNRYDESDMQKLLSHDEDIQAIFNKMPEVWKVILHDRYERPKKTPYKALSQELNLSIKRVKECELDMKEWLYNEYYQLLYKTN